MARAPYVHVNFQPSGTRRRVNADDLVRTLVDELGAGRRPRAARLPPVPVLEHQLGISENTVQAAYDELATRGVLVARERDGVFVAGSPAANANADSSDHCVPAPRLRTFALRRQRLPDPELTTLS